jgi:hypothetical protein
MPEATLLRLRLPQDLKVRLDRLAEATWTSASALTEEALAAYVDEQERMPKIRELGSSNAPPGCGDGRDLARVHFPSGVPGVMGGLHADPYARPVPEQLAESDRHDRGNRLPLLDDVVEMLAGDPEKRGDLFLGPTGRWDHDITQKLPRVRRASIGIADSAVLDHDRVPQ